MNEDEKVPATASADAPRPPEPDPEPDLARILEVAERVMDRHHEALAMLAKR